MKKAALLAAALLFGAGMIPQSAWASTALSGSSANENGASASSWNSTAIGDGANASERFSVAIGHEAKTLGWYAIDENITFGDAVAVGADSLAAYGSVAVGADATTGETGYHSVALGEQAKATGRRSIAISAGAEATAANAIAMGFFTRASAENAIVNGGYSWATKEGASAFGAYTMAEGTYSTAIGYQSVVTTDVVTENGNKVRTVSFGHQVDDKYYEFDNDPYVYAYYEEKYTDTVLSRLTNVAEGKADTDAVNYSQFKSYVASQIGSGSGTGTGTASASALAGNGLVATDDNKLAIDTSGGAIAENNTGFVTGGTIWKYIQDNAGSGSSAVIGDTTKLSDAGLADNVTDSILSVNDKLTKEGIYAAANGKVEIKNNAGDVAFTITGLNTDATDLGDTQKLVDAGLGKTVTDSILSVNDKVGSLSDDINKVGAGAAALAALRPEGFDPDDKWSFAVGYGHYKNANAGALGAFFKPNADTTVSLGGTIGNGDPMMNAGVSFKIGNRGKKAGTYRNAVELVRRVDGLEATMTKEVKRNDIQDSRLNAQEKKIAELEANIAKMQQKIAALLSESGAAN